MSSSVKIHLTFKSDISEQQINDLTTALDGSDNIRIYDYTKRTIIVIVLDCLKINNLIFDQLANVMCCKPIGQRGRDTDGDNIFVFVVPSRTIVDTSATANALQKLF